MINGKPQTSFLEDNCFVEEHSSCKAFLLENDKHCNDDKTLPLKLDCRFSAAASHLQNGDVDESSVSADSSTSSICQTPERKFDPFAACPDDLVLTPKDSDDLCRDFEEEKFSEMIFTSLFELIISTKLVEISLNNRGDSDQGVKFKTPIHSPPLRDITETCPPAPMRRSFIVKGFDHSICRKLDFENI